MHTRSASRNRASHGDAFPVHELVFVRTWAESRGLAMDILLDRVLDGAVFEETLVLRCPVRGRRAMTLWRAARGGVVGQVQGRAPCLFGGIHSALSRAGSMFAPGPRRAMPPWRRLLGWRWS